MIPRKEQEDSNTLALFIAWSFLFGVLGIVALVAWAVGII